MFDLDEIFIFVFVVPVVFIITLIFYILFRFPYYLHDKKKYKYPMTVDGEKLGLWWPFCLIHAGLKDNGRCPNCGVLKKDLVK